ncbi:MAG: T9SS type A sorting domain-containing protein [Chitinophagaceae bacterium]|nr:T9SS type A sorting domain-containing protein [Chitinophagaceae bacterium]
MEKNMPETLQTCPKNKLEEQLVFFQRTRYGWISPEGDLIATCSQRHLDVFKENPKYKKYFDRIEELKYASEQDEQYFTESFDPSEEHIPWHAYYSDSEEGIPILRNHIMNMVYNDGWIRINQKTWPTGLNEINAEQVSVYPNPARTDVRVSIDAPLEAGHIQLVNGVGAVVREAAFNGNSTLLVNDLARGVYFIKITSANQGSLVKKLILE